MSAEFHSDNMGYGGYSLDNAFLTKCFRCGKENWLVKQATGVCTWCKFSMIPYRDAENAMDEFVAESNRIEPDIHRSTDELYTTNHKWAVEGAIRNALVGDWLRPIDVHSMLLREVQGINTDWIGKYRHEVVFIGNNSVPKPAVVSQLMHVWTASAQHFISTVDKGGVSNESMVSQCFYFHNWFECIHPFMDGNGRVGRVMWLYMWLRCNLSYDYFLRQAYYDNIRSFRKNKFPRIENESLSKGKVDA